MQRLLRLIFIYFLFTSAASAQPARTITVLAPLGLNTVPTARMNAPGTMDAAFKIFDPYLHAEAGIQIAEPLHIALRQTALASDVNGSADRLFPGVDLRVRLWDERAYLPAAVLGLQSALGHKRMAAEYLTLSKRYNNFDFTGGMAWGRLGSAAHIENPLKILHEHFGKRRLLDGEEPTAPNDWFTGEDIGFFAGLSYRVPQISGLYLKADWGADRHIVESSSLDYKAPDPWSIGFDYRPFERRNPQISLGAAIIGGDKIMGRAAWQSPVQSYTGRSYRKEKPHHMRPYRTGLALPAEMARAAEKDDIRLYEMRGAPHHASAKMLVSPSMPLPIQLGRAARHMSNHAGEIIEELRITPLSCGLEGPEIRMQRRDLEAALAWNSGSPQEIWRNVSFAPAAGGGLFTDRFNPNDDYSLWLTLDSQISLSETDSGLLYRTALLAEDRRKLSERFWLGGAMRLDLADNLHRLDDFRPDALLPVRSNVDDFAARTLSVERSFLSWMTTVKPDLHLGVAGGYLEEMYAGLGGEMLYRPFGRTFAIGANAWQVFKRDPGTGLELGFNGDRLLTGHIDAWYEIPDSDLTLQLRLGRYLAEDIGGTVAVHRGFDNGARVEGFVTTTNSADFDVFGGTTHLYSGLKLTLPLGNMRPIPEGSRIRLTAAPLGRDSGQSLDSPLDLHGLSEPLSLRHIARHWGGVTR